jgi:hypothetical protein
MDRREALRTAALVAAALTAPRVLGACRPRQDVDPASAAALDTGAVDYAAIPPSDEDLARLRHWAGTLRTEGLAERSVPLGRSATRVGELAIGTPYEAFTLEGYIRAGGSPARTEPLTLSLTRFDCVSLVESCLAVARVAAMQGEPTWERFGREMERMRYRGGERSGYVSRLHYFSEWISDGERRGLLRDLGAELGGVEDTRPLRFMSENPGSYPALANEEVLRAIAQMERSLDSRPRRVVPTNRIGAVSDRIETGDILAFATSIAGLDVSHAAFGYRDGDGVLRVLHAPLSGGVVEVTRNTVEEYVRAIGRSTGMLVARPLRT